MELIDRDGLDEGEHDDSDRLGLIDGDLSRVKGQSKKGDSIIEGGASDVTTLSRDGVSIFDR